MREESRGIAWMTEKRFGPNISWNSVDDRGNESGLMVLRSGGLHAGVDGQSRVGIRR